MKNNNPIVPADQVVPIKIPIITLEQSPMFPGIFTSVVITKEYDIAAVQYAGKFSNQHIGFLLLRRPELPTQEETDFYKIGTVAKIVRKINLPDGSINIFITSLKRFLLRKLIAPTENHTCFLAIIETREEKKEENDEIRALTRALIGEMKSISENNPLFSEEVRLNMANLDDPGRVADFIASILNIGKEEQQRILEIQNLRKRMEQVLLLVKKEQELLKIQKKIQKQITEKIEKSQREYFLKEQLKSIKNELGIAEDGKSSDYKKFKEKISTLELNEEAREHIEEELEKFSILEQNNPEFGVIRNYLELVVTLPWNEEKAPTIDLQHAAKVLNKDHYGLDDVKERIIEFLAVQILKRDAKGSLLCLAGPPGVGKTSIGKSIARALNRKFFRFSVGGIRDEAEIKGHRRTYIGAMPGKILQGLKISHSRNPVFMIDEVDKLVSGIQGDPASALLEVLDSEQNAHFRDHYLNLPFDISGVFFITTANTVENILPPLLDRMEVIRLSGYIEQEKIQIAKKYLIPKSLKAHGLTKKQVSYSTKALSSIASQYAREAGLRAYEKSLNRIHRKVARKVIEDPQGNLIQITENTIQNYLGSPVFQWEPVKRITRPGICLGLAWTSFGGEVLVIEALLRNAIDNQIMQLTGHMGDVMKESASIAFSYVLSLVDALSIPTSRFKGQKLHLHIPAGATPKDGPSAGITMAVAILSLFLQKTVKKSTAMTGELSLVGDVLPIGGLREKIIAAKRNRIKQILFPSRNKYHLDEIPDEIKKGITFTPVSSMYDVIRTMFMIDL